MDRTANPKMIEAEVATARSIIARYSPITNRNMEQADALAAAWATLRTYGATTRDAADHA
jgi:hypothetical protein